MALIAVTLVGPRTFNLRVPVPQKATETETLLALTAAAAKAAKDKICLKCTITH